MLTQQTSGPLSLSGQMSQDGEARTMDVADAEEGHPDALLANDERKSAVDAVLAKLPPRHQQIMRLYYREGMTMKQISTTLGVNESRISQLHKIGLEQLSRLLVEQGITSSHAF